MRKQRWLRFSRRFLMGVVVSGLLICTPCMFWTPELFARWQVPLVALGFVLYIGVLLFDTLFFDHYH